MDEEYRSLDRLRRHKDAIEHKPSQEPAGSSEPLSVDDLSKAFLRPAAEAINNNVRLDLSLAADAARGGVLGSRIRELEDLIVRERVRHLELKTKVGELELHLEVERSQSRQLVESRDAKAAMVEAQAERIRELEGSLDQAIKQRDAWAQSARGKIALVQERDQRIGELESAWSFLDDMLKAQGARIGELEAGIRRMMEQYRGIAWDSLHRAEAKCLEVASDLVGVPVSHDKYGHVDF
jgi:chromosome segregation ATPase